MFFQIWIQDDQGIILRKEILTKLTVVAQDGSGKELSKVELFAKGCAGLSGLYELGRCVSCWPENVWPAELNRCIHVLPNLKLRRK